MNRVTKSNKSGMYSYKQLFKHTFAEHILLHFKYWGLINCCCL